MITVAIPKKELLRQLPQQAGYALLQWLDEMPKDFVFEALPAENREEELERMFPKLFSILRASEKRLFIAMYGRGNVSDGYLIERVSMKEERTLLLGPATSNYLAVHVTNLRVKLKRYGSSFEIIRHRGTYGQGYYQLVRKHE